MKTTRANGESGGPAAKTAIYARLSVNENGERDESLETQCALLAGYARERGWEEIRLYVDSDVSGTSFDRPGLARMVEAINNGEIGTVLVKDLSRLGRNNGETLTFLDFLAEKDVRLVSLGDGYDSFRDDDDTIGIRTWVNEYYARDISRKVRANLKKKMQSGEFLGRPPFGYLKSGHRKNRLEVDERYREIIREIFALYIQGWGYRALADHVQRMGVPTPSQDKGYAGAPSASRWEGQHIRRIITNRVYCGDTVQGVSEKLSFKSRKTRRLPGERWIIVPGTHEPIVTRETFELAQQVRKRRLAGSGRKPRLGRPHLFTGLVFCAACGSRHVYRRRDGQRGGYVCGRYNRLGRPGCTSHYVAEKQLTGMVLRDVLEMAAGVPFREQLARSYRAELASGDHHNRIDVLVGEIKARQRQLQTAYRDRLRGIISEELFVQTSAVLQRDISCLERQLAGLRSASGGNRPAEAMEVIGTLDPEMLNEEDIDRHFLEQYVNRIIVLEQEDLDAVKPAAKVNMDLLPRGTAGLTRDLPGGGVIIVYNLAPSPGPS